jgi:hypothetical protein
MRCSAHWPAYVRVPAVAQETLSTSGQSLQGTWISRIALPGGDFQTFEVGTYSADGSYIGANVDPSHSPCQRTILSSPISRGFRR